MADIWLLRAVFLAGAVGLTVWLRPFGWGVATSAGCGVVLAAAIVTLELRLRRVLLRQLLGAALGGLTGTLAASLVAWVLESSLPQADAALLQLATLLLFVYVGSVVGAAKGDALNLSALRLFGGDPGKTSKILDTSAIIDGRIVDVAETGFLDGPLIIPQFVLWELQSVADSPDPVKRNRGRRGLDILNRLRQAPQLDLQISETDYPRLKEVDQKLIELAKAAKSPIVTNDFNLNKLAQLHDVRVLNINDLANALKPVVLPGETMQVLILKEGKEYNQGVAYLDDGTMVVVDNARRQISRTVEIAVTSVLQTTAGKMIFGRYEEGEEERLGGATVSPGHPRSSSRVPGSPRVAGRSLQQGAGG